MNITWISHYFMPEIGAPSARLFDLSRQWLKNGHRVSAITCFPNHPKGRMYPGYRFGFYANEKLSGIDVHRTATYITPNRGFSKKLIGHVSLLPSAVTCSMFKNLRSDVMIGTSPTFFAAMAAAVEGTRRRIPFVMEVRDLWPAIFVELGVLKNRFLINTCERLELFLYQRAAKVVTVTETFRKNLIAKGIPSEKVVTIPNGADIEYWKPDNSFPRNERDPEFRDKFIVLYVGAHGISHALNRMIDVASRVQDHSDILFLFVGDGAEKPKLQKMAANMKLNNVSFRDPVDREGVRRYYQLADLCLVPLRNVPLFNAFIPSKMFEIMSMAKPMVASITGEAADIIKRSNGGVVVMPEDCEAITAALLDLYRSPEKRRKMGSAGRVFVSSYYNRKSLASQYMNVLEETVTGFRRGVNP
jgi:glycosyltransferase involved in cell wall biosynthesis